VKANYAGLLGAHLGYLLVKKIVFVLQAAKVISDPVSNSQVPWEENAKMNFRLTSLKCFDGPKVGSGEVKQNLLRYVWR